MAESIEISSRLPAPQARKPRVLLTGATGYIASQLLPVFRERYELTLIDVRATNARGETVDGVELVNLVDASDDTLKPHFAGVDAIVHLGYYRPPGLGVTGS